MCQQRNLRIMAIMLVFLIIASASIPPKKVEAIAGVDDIAILAVGGLIIAGLATLGVVSSDFSISSSDISEIKSKIEAGGETLITGVNNLGTAIKNGADKATIQALATGATIYGVLNVLQDTIFYAPAVENFYENGGTGIIYGVHDDKFLVLDYPSAFVSSYPAYFTTNGIWTNMYRFETPAGITKEVGSEASNLTYTEYYTDTGNIYSQETSSVTSYVQHDGIVYAQWLVIVDNIDPYMFDNFTSYTDEATVISNSESIDIPISLPDTIINNITNYVANPTSDLVLGIPDGVTYTDADLITVDPTTTSDDIPTDDTEPVDYADVLSATLAILTAVSPISGLLDNLNIDIGESIGDLIDVVTGTTDGVLTDIGSIVEPITSSIENFFSPPTNDIDWDKLKGIQIFDKFPFSIPADLIYLIGLLASDPVAPQVSFDLDLTFIGADKNTYTYDLSEFNGYAEILRGFELLAFVFFLLYQSKNMIWK